MAESPSKKRRVEEEKEEKPEEKPEKNEMFVGALENQLFEWKEWNEGCEEGDMSFEECTLVVDVGKYKAGTKFARIEYCPSASKIDMYTEEDEERGEPTYSVGLRLVVVPP